MERKIQSDVNVTNPVTIVVKDEKIAKPKEPWYTSPQFFDMIKWFFGTLVLGLLGLYTNQQIKETELEVQSREKAKALELQRMEIDSKLVAAVSVKFDTAKRVQLSYLIYIQPFISTDSIKVAVRRQILALGRELDSHVADSIKAAQSRVVAKARSELNLAQTQSAQKQAEAVPAKELPIATYKKESDSAFSNIRTSISDSSVILDIQKTKGLSTPKIEYDYILQRPPETKWCKEGYYVEFNNTLRVGINDLTKAGIVVNLKRVANNGEAVVISEKPITILNGASIDIEDGDYKYKISLDYIGGAGRNPFTQAAYITVASYKK